MYYKGKFMSLFIVLASIFFMTFQQNHQSTRMEMIFVSGMNVLIFILGHKVDYFHFHSERDSMTGLHNRHYIEKLLRKQTWKEYTVIFCDVDHFKWVNDNFGHNVGDEALKVLSNILVSSVEDGDIVCRWGGDEFLIIARGVEEKRMEALSKKVEDACDHARASNILPSFIRVSTGCSFHENNGKTLSKLIDEADNKMYLNKQNKRMEYGVH